LQFCQKYFCIFDSMSTYVINPTSEQENLIKAFLETNQISFFEEVEEELPQHVLDGIKRGQEDIEAGRFITHEEFIKRMIPIK
jgi:predicted transcriptional regulator